MSVSDLALELQYSEKTIVFADVVESVRLMKRDEPGPIRRIRQLLATTASERVPHRAGKVVEHRGDGLLPKRSGPRSAAAGAAHIHRVADEGDASLASDEALVVRVGIHQAAVVADETAVFGARVNLAARITSLAGSDETVCSAVAAGTFIAIRP